VKRLGIVKKYEYCRDRARKSKEKRMKTNKMLKNPGGGGEGGKIIL
jgi:hypothetical protein